MKFLPYLVIFLIGLSPILGQKSIEKALETWNKGSVPYIGVTEVAKMQDVVLLDARAKEEFEVSHLKNALWVGHQEFEIDSVLALLPDKNKPVVVYCSIGVRSEDIGEELLEFGYTDVKNLYGGIFEWKNNEYSVVDQEGKETEKIHAFNKNWGELLKKGEKVYSNK
ncbi:rhodanese-like domain-containing protein [Flavobacteriaceae bacterium TP-CH-4]|uniref:Rhodanese-like domain-containing protein n=1 Tax=Pelagihabitans pacificus TaxID=2696054 RepID=A0A967B063_9FLAO|nr:rhodanese-like domain-containing protein [Pelagihabitans pacificus]NHF60717.1 rhodanese-like domain-containing protein [Pelagihabitans pacificus]